MSHKAASSSSASESRFQTIFQAGLKSYQKQTKTDLLAHPLASQLQSCDSTAAIIVFLQVKVREFDKVHSGDERLTKWLGPTVNVLCAFSAVVSGGVGLVSLYTLGLKLSLICMILGIFTCQYDLYWHQCTHFGKYPVDSLARIILTLESL
jgi:hypothetical protein